MPSSHLPLHHYAGKRDFMLTPEPPAAPALHRHGPLLFVVQQHAARRLHYDFRLELHGVLKSWAVPKGFPSQPGEKHLAVMTEDHPLEYGSFEGVIPPKQYGAGNVIVWDCGLYAPDEDGELNFADREQAEQRIAAGLEKGKLSFRLAGQKLKGSFALIRTKTDWLLLKHSDALTPATCSYVDEERSVLCNATVEEVHPHLQRLPLNRLVPSEPLEAFPRKLTPMLAESKGQPFSDADWLFEPKLDGYRALAFIQHGEVALKSRNGIDLTAIFPEIAAELAQQPVQPLLLDGELVAFADGKPSFQALQARAKLDTPQAIAKAERATPTAFYCFDILHAAGAKLRNVEYLDRRRYLAQCLLPTPHVQLTAAEADGRELYRAALEAGFEGAVAKRKASRYLPGKRSGDWLKIKPVQSAEFVIGGYSQGKGSREALGALLLGYWDQGALRYAGNVGSGFDAATLGLLQQQLEQQRIPDSPFAEKLTGVGKPRWVKPELVAEVKYLQVTAEGKLRQPVFQRLRDDKDAGSIGVPHSSSAAVTEDEAEAVRAALADGATSLNFGGVTLGLTQLDKVLWPALGRRKALTKRDLLSYLALVAPYMLPLLASRPLTMIRLPDGIHGERFFQKHWEQALPPFVETVEVYSNTSKSDRQLLLCNNLATLLWLGQLGTLEFHIWHSSTTAAPGASQPKAFTGSETHMKHSNLNYPDYLVFDLDPYIYSGKEAAGDEPEFNRKGFAKSKEVAFALKALLDAMQLQAFVKLSGKTGLHIFVPIERTLAFDEARMVTELIGKYLMKETPQLITMEWSVAKRAGKIFFDHNMNVRGKTLNAAYSPRALAGATVSMPVSWQELTDATPQDFTVPSLAKRLNKRDDPWRDLLRCRQSVENVLNG